MDIGIRIRDLRTNVYKETSYDFAQRCGISKTCLLQIERGEVIKPTRKVLSKIEKSLDINLSELGETNGIYNHTRSQKQARFKNVLNSVCVNVKKDLTPLKSLANETLYFRDDESLDNQIDAIINLLEEIRQLLKGTCIETKDEIAYKIIDNLFNNDQVEEFPPRKKEEK